MTTRSAYLPAAERGATLFVALIILVLLSLVALAGLGTSLMQLRMSANSEMQSGALEQAQAATDNVVRLDYQARQPGTINLQQQYFAISGTAPDVNCTPNWKSGGTCARYNIALTSPLDGTTSTGWNQVKVTRLTDPVQTRTGCGRAALFQIESAYDRSALGQGKAYLVQGYQSCDYAPSGPTSSGPPITAASN